MRATIYHYLDVFLSLMEKQKKDTGIPTLIQDSIPIDDNYSLTLFYAISYNYYYMGISISGARVRGSIKTLMSRYHYTYNLITALEKQYNIDCSTLKNRLKLLREVYTINKEREEKTILEYLKILRVIG